MTICKHASNWNGWYALGGFSIKSKVVAIWSIGNHIYFVQFKNICTCNSQIVFSFVSCNYSTVTSTFILEFISRNTHTFHDHVNELLE